MISKSQQRQVCIACTRGNTSVSKTESFTVINIIFLPVADEVILLATADSQGFVRFYFHDLLGILSLQSECLSSLEKQQSGRESTADKSLRCIISTLILAHTSTELHQWAQVSPLYKQLVVGTKQDQAAECLIWPSQSNK